MPPTLRYAYFVSYAHARGFGMAEMRTADLVCSIADVVLLQDEATKLNGSPVVVINFQLLAELPVQQGEVTGQ